jgi:hypothetical protein
MAMQGLLAGKYHDLSGNGDLPTANIAGHAVAYADALITELNTPAAVVSPVTKKNSETCTECGKGFAGNPDDRHAESCSEYRPF